MPHAGNSQIVCDKYVVTGKVTRNGMRFVTLTGANSDDQQAQNCCFLSMVLSDSANEFQTFNELFLENSDSLMSRNYQDQKEYTR